MLVAIDVGNTETKIGCFDGGTLRHSWRLTTQAQRTADEYAVLFAQLFAGAECARDRIESVVIASVVPKADTPIEEACKSAFGCSARFFKAHRQELMRIATERPGEVGADLVACAIGGRVLYGAPLIVVSYGTATVFMAISAEGAYLGVAIAPGINVSIDALVGRTAKLPQIALEAPKSAIGTDTISALQSGIVYGYVGQTEALVKRFRAELGVDAPVIATGGMASAIARYTESIREVNPHLSLIGLCEYDRAVHDRNSRT